MNTGELIRKHRKLNNLSMKKLGELIGVSEQAISQYERGLRNVNLEVLIKISHVLNIPINNFTSDESIWIKFDKVMEVKHINLSEIPTIELLKELERRCL